MPAAVQNNGRRRVAPPSGAHIGGVEEHVDADAEQQHTSQGLSGKLRAGIECGKRDAGQKNGKQADERARSRGPAVMRQSRR